MVVTEANPIAEVLFESAGLGAGLAIDTVVTLLAVLFVVTTRILDRNTKIGLLAIITMATSYAVVNNLGAITRMGAGACIHSATVPRSSRHTAAGLPRNAVSVNASTW